MKILYLSACIPATSGTGGKRAVYNHLLSMADPSVALHLVLLSTDGSRPDADELPRLWPDTVVFEREIGRVGEGLAAKARALANFLLTPWPRAYTVVRSRAAARHVAQRLAAHRPDVIVVEHYTSMALLEDVVTDVPIVYISQNVEQDVQYDQMKSTPFWSPYRYAFLIEYLKLVALEKRLINKAAGVVCISSCDVAKTRALHKADAVTCWPELIAPKARRWDSPASKTLLFVGGAKYFPNHDAIDWLVNTLMPALAVIDPAVRLVVVGTAEGEVALRGDGANVSFKGFVSDADLAAYHYSSDLFISPVRLGSGIKIKMLDAVSYGMPIIAADQSLGGIAFLDFVPRLGFDDVNATAAAICALLDDPARLAALGAAVARAGADALLERPALHTLVRRLGAGAPA